TAASDFETSLVTVLGAFFLFSMPSLCLCQFLFIRGREFGVTMRMSIGGDHHRLQAQIKSNRLRSNFQWLHVFFYQDGNKVAFSVIFGDGDTTWLASIGQGTVPCGGKRGIHLRKSEMMPVPAKRIARIGSGLLMTFLFEGGIVSTSFEEVAKSFIKMPESLLQRNRRNLIKPYRLFLLLERDEPLRGSFVVQTLTMLIVRISTLSQCPIIDVATTSEGLRQYAFLFIAWVDAILVDLLLFHTLQYSTYAVKCQTVSLPITPRK